MNVTELINLLDDRSTGKTQTTPKERMRYLQYLNLANNELYNIAASGLVTIQQTVNLFRDDVNEGFVLPNDIFKINQISIQNKENLNEYSNTEYSINNNYLILNNKNIQYTHLVDPVDNISKPSIKLVYTPNPKKLVEVINNISTETNIPIYPTPFHDFLINGGLYYFYFSNKIFLEKMNYIREIWKENKAMLAEYKNNSL